MGPPSFNLRSWIAGWLMVLSFFILRKAGELFRAADLEGHAEIIESGLQAMWEVGLDTRRIDGDFFPDRWRHS